MNLFQIVVLRFIRLWIENHYEFGGGKGTVYENARQLHDEIGVMLAPRAYGRVEDDKP